MIDLFVLRLKCMFMLQLYRILTVIWLIFTVMCFLSNNGGYFLENFVYNLQTKCFFFLLNWINHSFATTTSRCLNVLINQKLMMWLRYVRLDYQACYGHKSSSSWGETINWLWYFPDNFGSLVYWDGVKNNNYYRCINKFKINI